MRHDVLTSAYGDRSAGGEQMPPSDFWRAGLGDTTDNGRDAVFSRLFRKAMLALTLAAAGMVFFGAGSAPAQDRVVVAESLCRSLSVHLPGADVAFEPGKDVYGRPVAPADLDEMTAISLDQELVIPLLVDLNQRYPQWLAGTGLDLSVSVGTLTIDGADIRLNDTPTGNQLAHALAIQCADQDRRVDR